MQLDNAPEGIIDRMVEAQPQSDDGRLTPAEERKLIEAARKGCGSSARRLVETHQDRLHAFVWRMVRDNSDAEEICQDAFLRAFQALDSFDNRYRFSTWLFTIAYRLSLNQIRRRRDYTGDVDFSRMSDEGGSDERPSDVGETLANSEEARLLKQTIWDSVEQLSAPQRATVLLFYRESMNCQEIGDVLNMPAATVKSHLHRARARLKDSLSERMDSDWTQVRFGELDADPRRMTT